MILDSEVLYLFLVAPEQLPGEIVGLIRSGNQELAVSSTVLYEWAALHRRGNTKIAPREVRDACREFRISILDITDEELLQAGELQVGTDHPWLRITAVQAKRRDVPVISDKTDYDDAGAGRMWI